MAGGKITTTRPACPSLVWFAAGSLFASAAGSLFASAVAFGFALAFSLPFPLAFPLATSGGEGEGLMGDEGRAKKATFFLPMAGTSFLNYPGLGWCCRRMTNKRHIVNNYVAQYPIYKNAFTCTGARACEG
jgi:hypothetical protein